jgi:hypothetical protein
MRFTSCHGNHSDDVPCVDLTPIFAASAETFTHACSPVLTGAPQLTHCPDISLMARLGSDKSGCIR